MLFLAVVTNRTNNENEIIMNIQVKKGVLELRTWKTNVLYFIPKVDHGHQFKFAIFTHGYTAHKGDLVNWGHRMALSGLHCAIFDLPGHYLGSFNEVESFEEFRDHSPQLFYESTKKLCQICGIERPSKLVLGGHSLGGLLAITAMMLPEFAGLDIFGIAVGTGLQIKNPFFETTLKMRSQLTSPTLKPENIIPWFNDRADKINTKNQIIHLISGMDDLVTGENGPVLLKELLEKLGNTVTLFQRKNLPHHQPELASPFIYSFLKKSGVI